MKTTTQVGTIIRPDGTTEKIYPAKGGKFTLEELQKAIGGGYIERIATKDGVKRCVLYADEDGKLKGLPVNIHASVFMSPLHMPTDLIVGTALLVSVEKLGGEAKQKWCAFTPAGTMCVETLADTREESIALLLKAAKHMPYRTWENFEKRGYEVEQLPPGMFDWGKQA